jgi:hypothetical protein
MDEVGAIVMFVEVVDRLLRNSRSETSEDCSADLV